MFKQSHNEFILNILLSDKEIKKNCGKYFNESDLNSSHNTKCDELWLITGNLVHSKASFDDIMKNYYFGSALKNILNHHRQDNHIYTRTGINELKKKFANKIIDTRENINSDALSFVPTDLDLQLHKQVLDVIKSNTFADNLCSKIYNSQDPYRFATEKDNDYETSESADQCKYLYNNVLKLLTKSSNIRTWNPNDYWYLHPLRMLKNVGYQPNQKNEEEFASNIIHILDVRE